MDEDKLDLDNLTTYDRLLKLKDRGPKTGKIRQNKAGQELKHIVNDLCEILSIPLEGPHDPNSVFDLLSKHYCCQIHLIAGAEEVEPDYQSYPEKFDESLPQIFLYKINERHVVHIHNLKQFFKDNRSICFHCRKTYSIYHKCPKKQSCNQCSRRFATSTTKQWSYLPFQYCDKHIKIEDPQTCPKCLQEFTSQLCMKNHNSKCGSGEFSKLGQVCQTCKKFVSFKIRGQKTPAEILENHKCFSKYRVCKYCYEYFPASYSHSCQVRKKELTKTWPNLVFFNFEYKNLTNLYCKQCKNLKLEYLQRINNTTDTNLYDDNNILNLVCDKHKDPRAKLLIPNVAVIWRESERGVFEEYIITDQKLNDCEEKNPGIFKFEYFTETNVQPYVTETPMGFKEKTVSTGSFIDQLNQKVASKKNNIIFKFLQMVTQPSWRNSTLLSWNDKYSHLGTIIEALLTIGTIPKIFHKKQKIFSVILENQNLKFMDACNYFPCTLHELATQYGINFDKMFFPHR